MPNNPGNPRLSPSFRAVTEIAQHVGRGMAVARFEVIRFPTGTIQVWEFTPHAPASAHGAGDSAPVVSVFLKGRGIDRWKPLDQGFEEALAHYQRVAASAPRRRVEAALPAYSSPIRPPVPMTFGHRFRQAFGH